MSSWLFEPFEDLAWWIRGQNLPESRAFDARWGTDTAAFDLFNYEPSHPEIIDEILAATGFDPRGWTFVDLGSGKGRAVLLASLHPFVAAVGVEHRPGLHRKAVDNGQIFEEKAQSACPVRFVLGDAAVAPLPDGPLLVYLYNPFPADVVDRVLGRLEGRDAVIVYVNPREALTVEARGWTEVQRSPEVELKTWRLYRRTR